MTCFDYVVLFILIASIVISTMRGLVKEILSLAAWVIAFLAANAFAVQLAPIMPFAEESIRLILAFVALFIGVHLLMWILSLAIDSVITALGLKPVDRTLGSVFGAARGCVIVLVLMLVCGMTNLPEQPFWKHALLRPAVEAVAMSIKPYLPGSFARYVKFS